MAGDKRIDEPKRDDRKLKELILYVAQKTATDPNAGAIKLNKILFYSEVRAYLTLGSPISGHPYMARELGPAPRDLKPIRKNLEVTGAARVDQVAFGNKTQARIVPLRSADLSLFSADEIAVVDEVIAEFWPLHWSDLRDTSHEEPGYRAAARDAEIPYEAAFVSNRVTQADIDRGLELALAHGWA